MNLNVWFGSRTAKFIPDATSFVDAGPDNAVIEAARRSLPYVSLAVGDELSMDRHTKQEEIVMIGLIVNLSIQAGKEAEFEQVARDLMAKVKANEPGCLTYQLYKTKDNAYVFLEEYASKADLDAHGKTEHYTAAAPKMGACLTGAPEITFLTSVD